MGYALVEGPTIAGELIRFMDLAPSPWKIGEVVVRPTRENSFHVFHRGDLDRDPASLRILPSPEDLREMIRIDRAGNFRPLRASPNLRDGWLLHAPGLPSLQLALDYIYPTALANWMLWRHVALPTTPWPETTGRQTGRFNVVREIDEPAMLELVTLHCQPGCLKQRLWPTGSPPLHAPLDEIPLICPEACNFLIAQAREKLKGPGEE